MAITGEIVGMKETDDAQRNIIIWVCFKNNGIEIPFYLNETLLEVNGKKVWPLYSQFLNFAGRSAAEIHDWVKINIEHQIGNLIKEAAKSVINDSLVKTNLPKLVGTVFSKDFVVIEGMNIKIYPDGTVG